jgi:hypothetical protein
MTTSPSKEDLDAYREALGAAYATIDEAKTHVETARERIEEAKDEARRLFDPSTAAGIFNGVLSDADLADRAIVDMIDGMPALEEEDTETDS